MHYKFSDGTWRDGTAHVAVRYCFALFLFLVALIARYMLVGVLPARGFPFLSFFPAVLLATYMVGLGPGLLVALLSTASAWAFFMGPAIPPSQMARSDLIALIFFAVILAVDCLVIERMNLAVRNLRATSNRLRASEDALMERQNELREADKQKDIFIAMLAHELRNPLAPILSAAQLINARAKDNEPVSRAAAIITRQSLQLTRLVDDLLDVSRIHSSKLTLNKKPVDLRKIIASALETSRPIIDASQRNFSVEVTSQALPVEADSLRIAQCLSNLLHNAFKFTEEYGNIKLSVTRPSVDRAMITVIDNGRGISADMLPKLFDMFSQESSSGNDGNSGLGIGLALTSYLVTQHGGTLTAHSEGRGQGARFELVLPLTEATITSDPEEELTIQTVANSTILIVDDNADAAETLQALLELHGFDVSCVGTGIAALTAMASRHYNAVLLDIGLPDISGYEVATRGRASGILTKNTIVIALTGWTDSVSRDRSVSAGIDHHLNKPLNLNDLLRIVPGTPSAKYETSKI